MRSQVARFLFAISLTSCLWAIPCIAQDNVLGGTWDLHRRADPALPDRSASGAIVSGVVLIANGAPAGGATVELISMSTGQVLGSTVTLPDGGFALHSITPGEYEVRASAGPARTSANLHLDPGGITGMHIVLPAPDPGAAAAASVSLNALQTPAAARKELEKAQQRLNKGRYDEAAEHVDAALRTAPDYAPALSLQALLLMNKGNLNEAVPVLDHALKADASCMTCYMQLADIFNAQGQFAEARRAAEQALRLAPNAWQLHFELGKALAGLGDFQAAMKEFTHAESSAPPRFGDIHYVMGWVAASAGALDRAEVELRRYLQTKVKSPFTRKAQKLLANVQLRQLQASALPPR